MKIVRAFYVVFPFLFVYVCAKFLLPPKTGYGGGTVFTIFFDLPLMLLSMPWLAILFSMPESLQKNISDEVLTVFMFIFFWINCFLLLKIRIGFSVLLFVSCFFSILLFLIYMVSSG